MPTEGFNFLGYDDPYQALMIVAEILRFHPEEDAEVGPWSDEVLYGGRRIQVKGSDDLISLVAKRLNEAGIPYFFDRRPSLKMGDGTYIRYVEDV